MLSGKNIPKSFWPEAVNWTIYVLNRSSTLVVKDVALQGSWSGAKSLVAYFRVFGCVSHMHVPEARKTKLDNRRITCVLLGVSEESKGYRLFNPIIKRILVSKDRIFEEDKQWDWDGTQPIPDLEWDDGENERNDYAEIDVGGSERNDVVEIDVGHDTNVGEEFQRRRRSSSEGEDRVRVSINRQPPTWMGDYVPGKSLLEEESHMALMVTNDPTCLEEAVKDLNWR